MLLLCFLAKKVRKTGKERKYLKILFKQIYWSQRKIILNYALKCTPV